MLDLLFTLADNLLTYAYKNPHWGKAEPIGENQESEAWANSDHEVVFGDKTSWTIGLGNTTNSFGPRIDFNVDYSYYIKNIADSKAIGGLLGGKLGAALIGTTGFFTLTFGPETTVSYGASDVSLQRKRRADQEFEIIDDKGPSTTPRAIITINLLCTGIIATAVILARINHFRGFLGSNNFDTVNKVNKALIDASKVVQPRYLAVLTKMELAYHAKGYIKETIEKLKDIPKYILDELEDATKASANRIKSVLNKLKNTAEIEKELGMTKAEIITESEKAMDIISNQITFVGSILDLFQDGRANWYESNQNYSLLCKKYTLEARGGWEANPFTQGVAGEISLKSVLKEYDQTDGNPGKTLFESNLDVKSNSINMKIVEDGTTNVSSIDATKDSIILESKGVYIKCHDDKDTICTLHMEKNIDIQCGKAATGPSLKMDGKENTAILSVGTKTLGKAIGISEDSLEFGHLGKIQKELKRPRLSISSDKVVISAGISSITLNATGIELESGPSKLSLDLTQISAISTIIEQQSKLNNRINAVIRTLKTNGIQIDKAGVTTKQ